MSNIVPTFDIEKLAVSGDVRDRYEMLANVMAGKREGFEEMQREWRPAILKIVQPVTTDSAKPATAKNGDVFHKGGSVKLPLRALLAYAWTSRVRFVNGVDKRPSCSSENVDLQGRGAQDKSLSIYGDSCAKCPYDDQPFSKGKPGNCNNILNVILVPESLENVFQFQFSRAGYNIGRQFTDLAMATPYAWSRFYDFATEGKKRDKGGLYYVPSITPVADVEVPEHLKVFAQYVNRKMAELRIPQKALQVARQDDGDVSHVVAKDEKGKPDFQDAF
jgi:hypothetical protein